MGGSKDLRIRKIPKFTSYQGIHNKEDIGFRKSPLAPLLRQAQEVSLVEPFAKSRERRDLL